MSIYHKEKPKYFDKCMQSIWDEQSIKADEIILVQDGKLTDKLYKAIEMWKERLGKVFKVISLEKNVGLGNALNEGLKHCSHEWVARMDTDDIALPNRFEEQCKFLDEDSDMALVGTWIDEYDMELKERISRRTPPQRYEDIVKFSKIANPFNHMSVMFKKSSVLKAGGYVDMQGREDYYLWIRMLQQGANMANLPMVLMKVRAGHEMIKRRHGYRYFAQECAFASKAYKIGYFDTFDFLRAIVIRALPRLLPKYILEKFYLLARKLTNKQANV